ncbi:MAG: hypothetical protein WAV16_03715 [Candidatus Moraniibacteriota bacterium]
MLEAPTLESDGSNQEIPKPDQEARNPENLSRKDKIKQEITEIKEAEQSYKDAVSKEIGVNIDGLLKSGSGEVFILAEIDRYYRNMPTDLKNKLVLKESLEKELINITGSELIDIPNKEGEVSTESDKEEDKAKLEEVMKKISDIK